MSESVSTSVFESCAAAKKKIAMDYYRLSLWLFSGLFTYSSAQKYPAPCISP